MIQKNNICCIPPSLERQILSHPKIKYFISKTIINYLKEIYKPIGLWGENVSPFMKKEERNFGVIINGEYSALNLLDTNYTAISFIFNNINKYITKAYAEENIMEFYVGDMSFSAQNLIRFDKTWNYDIIKTLEDIKKMLILFDFWKDRILAPNSKILPEIIAILKKTWAYGGEAQKTYEKHLFDLFDGIIDYKTSEELGGITDIKHGIDLITTQKNIGNKTHQIKKVGEIINKPDVYKIQTALSQTNKCDFISFVTPNEIYVFENIKFEYDENNKFLLISKKYLHKKISLNEFKENAKN